MNPLFWGFFWNFLKIQKVSPCDLRLEHFVSDFRKYAILINSPSQNHESEHFSLRIFGFEGFTFVKVVLRNWVIQVSWLVFLDFCMLTRSSKSAQKVQVFAKISKTHLKTIDQDCTFCVLRFYVFHKVSKTHLITRLWTSLKERQIRSGGRRFGDYLRRTVLRRRIWGGSGPSFRAQNIAHFWGGLPS